MKVIGIDLGTTGISGILLDASSGEIIRTECQNSNAFIKTENTYERIQDVDRILSIAKGIVDSFIDGASDISAIGITGQMHGILYVDDNGIAVSPLYTWQDGRGELPYRGTTYAQYLGSFSGYGNVTDFYNRENSLVPQGAVTYCTVHDHLAMRLTGNKRPILHASDAASLGLYDIEKKKFAYDYTERVTDGFEIIGRYRNIPVSVAIGDNQASVFSTLANEDDLLINIGTGSQISIVSEKVIKAENIETRPYFGGRYLTVGSALCGGRAYSALGDLYSELFSAVGLKNIDVYRVMDELLSKKSDTTLKVDTRFSGTRSDASIRGAVYNISTDNLTPADLTLATLYGMVEELYGMYLSMGETKCGIVGSGNGIRKNKALVRAAEKVFGAKVKIPRYREEAALGAAMFALVASGVYRSGEDVQKLIRYED